MTEEIIIIGLIGLFVVLNSLFILSELHELEEESI